MAELNETTNFFTANGQKYYVSNKLSVSRFRMLEELVLYSEMGAGTKDIFALAQKAFDQINKGQIANASVSLHNLLTGAARKIEQQPHPILQICALFICRENEETGKFDEALSAAKIDDWEKEGMAIEDFFLLGRSYIKAFLGKLNEGTEITTEGGD